jgi:hypothetical protein
MIMKWFIIIITIIINLIVISGGVFGHVINTRVPQKAENIWLSGRLSAIL